MRQSTSVNNDILDMIKPKLCLYERIHPLAFEKIVKITGELSLSPSPTPNYPLPVPV